MGSLKLFKSATRYAKSAQDLRRIERWLAKQTSKVVAEDFRPILDVIRENMRLSQQLADANSANAI